MKSVQGSSALCECRFPIWDRKSNRGTGRTLAAPVMQVARGLLVRRDCCQHPLCCSFSICLSGNDCPGKTIWGCARMMSAFGGGQLAKEIPISQLSYALNNSDLLEACGEGAG